MCELLLMSALAGDIEVVSRLVCSQYVHVDVADRRGNTALHCAAVSPMLNQLSSVFTYLLTYLFFVTTCAGARSFCCC